MKVKGVWSGEKIIRPAISAWGRGGYKKIDTKIASSRRHFPWRLREFGVAKK